MSKHHKTAPTGKRVRIVLTDGSSFVDKFIERENSYIRLYNFGKLKMNKYKSMTIVRGEMIC